MNYLKFDPFKLEGEGINDGRSVLYVDVLPKKSCSYNCFFCPRPKYHMGPYCDFGDVTDSLLALDEEIEKTKPDLVYLYANGDPLTNDKIEQIINCVHAHNVPVRTIANGPMLGKEYHMKEANLCEEVVGCMAMVTEEAWKKMHRPYEKLTFEGKYRSLIEFSNQYKGHFILRVVIIKGWNDSEEDLAILKSYTDQIRFDELSVGTRPNVKGGDVFAVSDEFLEKVRNLILSK